MKEYIEREANVDKTMSYISGKQCLDTFYKLFVMEDTRIAEATEEEIFRFQYALGMTPTADVAPVVHGEWIHKNGEIYCSVCGSEALMDEVYYESPCCPDCGSRMDGGK